MLISNVYSQDYEIKYYEQNLKGDLKESALLNFLQDIATKSAESLGFGPTFVFANNYAWVVLKYHIELYKKTTNLNKITIKTEPRGCSKLCAFRDFELYSETEELIGRVCSTWALIDKTSRRMLPVQKVLPQMFLFEKREDDLEYVKIDNIEQVEYQKEFEVRFDDIDVNQHANNSNYVIWALEALPQEFREKHSPVSIDIKYRKEISLGGIILSEVQKIESENEIVTIHFIKDKNTGEELTTARFIWK